MRAIIIYDLTGRIWNIIYGSDELPQGIPCMFVDIPDGAQIDRIDVTDPDHPKAVFTYLPESDIGRLQKAVEALKAQLDTIDGAVSDLGEATSAIAEAMSLEGEETDKSETLDPETVAGQITEPGVGEVDVQIGGQA